MTQPTKKQQKGEAGEAYDAIVKRAQEAYDAIVDPAYKAYRDKIAEINARPDEVEQTITINGRQYKLIEENNNER
jgi:hypothetical protein